VATFTDRVLGPKIANAKGITDDAKNAVRNRILFWCTVIASTVTVVNVLYNWLF